MSKRTHLLVERLRRGDKAALSELYRETSSKAYGIILALIGTEKAATQTLRELYLNIWEDPHAVFGETIDPARHVLILARRRAVDLIASDPDLRREDARHDEHVQNAKNEDKCLLESAYLGAAHLDELAARFNLTPQEAQARLWTDIVDMKGDQT